MATRGGVIEASKTLKAKTITNLRFSAFAVVATNVMQFFTSIILARMLVAADYGVVGYSQLLINFMMQFSDLGLNSALIQKKEIDEKAMYAGLTLKVLLSMLVMVLMIVSSPLFTLILSNKDLGLVTRVLSLNFVFSAFSFLPQVVLARDLQYRKLVFPQTAGFFIGAAVSIIMAFGGYGFWSLVTGNLVNNGSTAILLNFIKPVRYRWAFDREVLRELATFGWHMVLPGIIIFIIMNADNFMVGSFKGALSLGYYTIAFNWGSMICTVMAAVVHKVLFPTFSRMQHDLGEIKTWYLKSVKYIAMIAVPVNVGLFLIGREFLFFVLGKGTDRWIAALPALKVLALYGIARALLEPVGNVISGIGKPQYFLKANLVAAAIEIMGVFFALVLSSHLAWVAAAVLIAYLAQYVIYYRIMRVEISLAAKEVSSVLYPALAAAVVMAVGLVMAQGAIPFSLVGMIIQILFGGIIYVLIYGTCDRWKTYGEMAELYKGIGDGK